MQKSTIKDLYKSKSHTNLKHNQKPKLVTKTYYEENESDRLHKQLSNKNISDRLFQNSFKNEQNQEDQQVPASMNPELTPLKPNIYKSQRKHLSPNMGMKRFAFLYDRAMNKPQRMFNLELKGESEIFAPKLNDMVRHKNRLVEFKSSTLTPEEKLKLEQKEKITLFNKSLKQNIIPSQKWIKTGYVDLEDYSKFNLV